MKKNIVLIKFLSLVICLSANAQSAIETTLVEIARNNKTLQANRQYWESQRLLYKAGIVPQNPTVEYDYLSGSPAGAGNQTEFSVTQSIDFPTAYIKKKQLSDQQIAQAEFQLVAIRQDILLKAKKICIELVYRNKLNAELTKRKEQADNLFTNFKIKLDKGAGNILDVNKSQIQLIEIKKEYQENISAINQLNEKLTALNGGVQLVFNDTVYFTLPSIPAFEQLEQEFENSDPLRKIFEQEKLIALKQVEVSRSLSLPKIEAGYHYQGILGQKYNGIHTGISIPLWENRNTVKLQKAKYLFADLELEEHRNEHYYEIKQFYAHYQNLKITLAAYQEVFQTLNSSTLLSKALSSGHITSIEYFMEMNYYKGAFINYLNTEKEYYEVIAELYKFTL